jgi:2-polyprenyl-3-methyl-5-hydroxy-6-metoxy-1,4-benzoquinol methylase
VPSVSSLVNKVRSAWAGTSRDALSRDGAHFWAEMEARPADVRQALYRRYSLVPRPYIDRYVDHIRHEHGRNPLAPLYIESELGAPARQLLLLSELERHGITIAGKRCLDIGCSNGSLLLAARRKGAARAVGVDVSEGRIASAREFCEGSNVELRVLDLATTDLPPDTGPFDLIVCTDVLEHVGSIPGILAAMARLLETGPDARIFITVFNHLNATCVLSEPHYGIPGLVLLDRAAAAEIWTAVRAQLTSNLDYEVEHWPEYSSLAREARRVGLTARPHIDVRKVLAKRARFWAGYAQRLEALRGAAATRLGELTLSREHRALLLESIDAYCRTALADHRSFEASRSAASDEAVIDFFMRYYAQPIRFFLKRV